MVAQAYSGLMSITGPEEGVPCRVGTSIGDLVAGHQAALGILAALWHRQATGKGQHVDISMVDGLVSVLENAIIRYSLNGEVPTPLGTMHPTITPFQAFQSQDGWVVVAIGNDKLWERFCVVLEKENWTKDSLFLTNPLRTENRKILLPMIQEVMKKKTTQEWLSALEQAGIPYSPVNTIDKVFNDPVLEYRKMIVEIEQPQVGKMKIVGSPFHLSETPGSVRSAAPLLGEHTSSILKEVLGYVEEEIEALKKLRVIN